MARRPSSGSRARNVVSFSRRRLRATEKRTCKGAGSLSSENGRGAAMQEVAPGADAGSRGLGAEWVACYRTPVDHEAHIVKGFLGQYGVPCVLESMRFRMEPLTFGALGDILVLVPPEWSAVARGLIAGRADSVRKEAGE